MSIKKYILWSGFIFLVVGLVLWLGDWDKGSWTFYIVYMIGSTSFLALPHEPLVYLFGKTHGIILPALMAVGPTMIGCYLDYFILSPVLNGRALEPVKTKFIYRKIASWFDVLPFMLIFIGALSPVPFYPIRLMSIAQKYSKHKYMIAVAAGRLPRFMLIAAGAQLLTIPDKYIFIIFALMIIWYICLIIFKNKHVEIKLRKGIKHVS